jgi:hypothetical protein
MKNPKQIKQELAKRDGLRCAVTGEEVGNIAELEIDHRIIVTNNNRIIIGDRPRLMLL